MAIKTNTIVTRYEVVTINHEQGVDRIKQKQQQLNLTLKDWNEEAKRVEQVHTKAWKAVGLALAGVTVAVMAGRAGFQQYAKESRLTAASAGIDIAQLDKAAGGLQTRMELLEFAAKTQAGAFKLTTAQMVEAQAAIRAITRDGHEQEEVTKKVTDAIIKLEGDGLKDFGIRVRQSTTDTEKFTAIMDALSGKAHSGAGAVQSETESVQALGVRFENAGDKIVSSLGRIVVALTPLLEGVAWLADKTAGLVGDAAAFADFAGTGAANFFASDEEREAARVAWGKRHGIDMVRRGLYEEASALGQSEASFITGAMFQNASDPLHRPAESGGPSLAGSIDTGLSAFRSAFYYGGQYASDALGKGAERAKKAAEAGKKAKAEYDRVWNEAFSELIAQASDFADVPADYVPSVVEWNDLGGYAAQPDVTAAFGRFDYEQKVRESSRYDEFNAGRTEKRLEKVFGPLTDFNAYATAFQTLQGAVGSAMGAWIDGSKSASAAFKDFIGQALGGVAVQMAMEAVKHGAYALGSLAFGNFAGAALHGKAAAAFAAGAIVVGAAAKALHGGSSSSAGAGAGSAAPTYSPAAGGGGDTGKNVTIVYGNDFAYGSSARQRGLHAQRIVNDAMSSGGVTYAP